MTDIGNNVNYKAMKKTILVAGGATGYLGRYLVKAFHDKGYEVDVIVRNEKKLEDLSAFIRKVYVGNVTDIDSLEGIMDKVNYVVSTVGGITRQKDGMTYMDVDYGANMNLLNMALKSNVEKFMYISALKGDQITDIKIGYAKEKFVQALLVSDIQGLIMRPSGFFSDIREIYELAKKGKVYLFGQGKYRSNPPIHGEDLANYCVMTMDKGEGQYPVGGGQSF